MATTITTDERGHGLEQGDIVCITMRDTRWWRRAWYYITRRKDIPTRTKQWKVSNVSTTTFDIK